jgi:hypothetical protein
MSNSIQDYLQNPDVIQNLIKCNLDTERRKTLLNLIKIDTGILNSEKQVVTGALSNIFAMAADAYIGTPQDQPPGKFTAILKEFIEKSADVTKTEAEMIIDALDLKQIEIYIENRSLSHDKAEQDILSLLKNSIWVADRLIAEQTPQDFQYPNIGKINEALALLHQAGLEDTDITVDMINDFWIDSRNEAASVVIASDEEKEKQIKENKTVLDALILALEPEFHNKKLRYTDSSYTEFLAQRASLVQKLKELKTANKSLTLSAIYDLSKLRSTLSALEELNDNEAMVALGITPELKQLIIDEQSLLRKEFSKNSGLNAIKQLLMISGASSWNQVASNPKLFFSQINVEPLLYTILVLASKGSEDNSLHLNYLAKFLKIYRPTHDPEYHLYQKFVSQLNALEKFVIILLKHDLSLDRQKMSQPTKEFFERMGYMHQHRKLRHT